MEIFEIEWMPFAPSKRKWWVYGYACGDNGEKLVGPNVPTNRLAGQYNTLEEATAVYPKASLSEKTKQAIADKRV